MSPDSIRYSGWADILIKQNFNFFKFVESTDFIHSPVYYYNWVTIVSLNKLLLGENWGLGVVALNMLSGIFVAILLFKTTWFTTEKPDCAIFAGLLLLLCYEFILWIPFVLSDILFSTICFSTLILTIGLYQQPKELLNKVAGVVVLVGIALFFRPTWPPLLMFTILSMPLAVFFGLIATDSTQRHNFIIGCVLFACVFIPAIIFYHAFIMQHPEKWPFPFLIDTVSYVSIEYQQGSVVHARPATYHSSPGNILEYAFISLHKFIAFFYLDVPTYSFKHALFNYILFLPVYGLSIFAITKLFKKDDGPLPLNWWSIFSCALFIFFFAFFHSLTHIDFDFRYRVPCMLPLLLLATLGLNELINNFAKRA
jgi:hypothetical protein